MTDAATLLLVEDDPAIRTFLADNLTADGYELLVADDARARRCARSRPRRPDLAVLDLGLPDGSGLDLIRRVRAADGVGIAAGPGAAADGPLRPRRRARPRARLRARRRRLRLQAVLVRRAAAADRGGAAALADADAAGRDARRRARDRPGRARDDAARAPVELAAKEFALLRTLAAEPTRVFTKDELLRDVWGFRPRAHTRTLDSHACRLRQKLASPATSSSSTSGASATGSSTVRPRGAGRRDRRGPAAGS